MIAVGILTISDSSFEGIREDQSGPVICEMCKDLSWKIAKEQIVPDDEKQIIDFCKANIVGLHWHGANGFEYEMPSYVLLVFVL